MLSFGSRADVGSLRRLRLVAQSWLDAEVGPGRLATVSALPCREEGCPPFETVVQILDDELPIAFAMKKLASEVTDAELVDALRRGAEACQVKKKQEIIEEEEEEEVEDVIISDEELKTTVSAVVEATEAIDVHTHLFPPSHGDLMLWGIDALLTYHYLVSEFFMVALISHDAFFSEQVGTQASLVWKMLFCDRTPVSEAQIGVLTTLKRLGVSKETVHKARRTGDLSEVRSWFNSRTPEGHCRDVFRVAKIKYVVMTNVPFDAREASKYVQEACCIDPEKREFKTTDDSTADLQFHTALRVDALLAGDWATVAASLKSRGLEPCLESARVFLVAWARRYKAEYLMASTPANFKYGRSDDAPLEPGWPSCTELVDEVLVPVASELGLPLALKLGAERNMAPPLKPCGGGDGLEVADTAPLKALLTKNPKLKVLATFLSRVNQHECCVMAQKFRNLHIYGCWWYCNNPSIISEITTMRLEMLGTAFTAQHSDCRVLDQLVYKWAHSRKLIAAALTKQYEHLLSTGWTLTLKDVKRDVKLLLGGAYEDFLKKDLS